MITYNRGPEQVVKVSRDIIPALEEWGIQSPSASFICEAAKMQREEYGDGVTAFVLLTTALVTGAERLMGLGVHPNTIIEGYRKAGKKANEVLEELSTEIDEAGRLEALKGVDSGRDLVTRGLCGEVLEASEKLRNDGAIHPERARFQRMKGGSAAESKLVGGMFLKGVKAHPGMPDSIDSPRIALLSGGLAYRVETKMRGDGPAELTVSINDPKRIGEFRVAEAEKRRRWVDRLGELGVNALFSGQPLDDTVKGLLARRGIFAVEGVSREDAEAIGHATGAEMASSMRDLDGDCLGSACSLRVEEFPPGRVIELGGCGGASFLLRGSTDHSMDELEASLKNAIRVLKVIDKTPRVVSGGGAAEMEVARSLSRYALEFPGREQAVIEQFAEALEEIPGNLAANCGFDKVEALAELRSLHETGRRSVGIGTSGCSENVCLDALGVKRAWITRAVGVATLMIGIDSLLISNEIAKFHKK